jgi:predicted acyl esterase
MQRPSWANRPALIIGAAALAVVAVVVVVVTRGSGGPSRPAGVATDKQARITTRPGVTLSAEVTTPKGRGPFPLVVMPASWGSSDNEYRGLALQMSDAGYVVVGYAQAGFAGSGGEVDYAAAPTQRDASSVISWALKHTPADSKRIGMLGVSYGGGVSLLAAARDPRIKAVVAMSTWTDLASCFYPNETTSTYSLGGLMSTAQKTGHLSAPFTKLTKTLGTDPPAAGIQLQQLSAARSAATVIAQLNRNHPAVMIANAYEDSIIAPLQLVGFYDKLTGPKRLQLSPGDHGGPEYPGLLGSPDVTTAAGTQWLAHYLRGTANGIDKHPPVELQDVVTRAWHSYPAWPTGATALQIGAPSGSGGLTTGAAQSWSASIEGGTETVATSGPAAILSGLTYTPPKITLDQVDRKHAFVWTGPAVGAATLVSGTPRLHLDVQSSTGSASLFAYLYDVDGSGHATLMSVTPYTTHAASGPTPVSIELEPTSWTFVPGHRIALVIDTVDARWYSASKPGSTVTVSSSATDGATLTLPLAS